MKTEGDKYIISIEVERDALDWTLDPNDSLKVEQVGGILTVCPKAAEEDDARFKAAMEDVFARYEKTFTDLAK